MATIPTPEETARQILKIFVDPPYRCRAGDVLQYRNFVGKIDNRDFDPGMQYAIQQGWIQDLGKGSYKLTQTGFDEA